MGIFPWEEVSSKNLKENNFVPYLVFFLKLKTNKSYITKYIILLEMSSFLRKI